MRRIDRSLGAVLVLLSAHLPVGAALAVEPAKQAVQGSEPFKLSDLSLERLLGLPPLRNVASLDDAGKTTSSIAAPREARQTQTQKGYRKPASARTQVASTGVQTAAAAEPIAPVATDEENTATGAAVTLGAVQPSGTPRPDNIRPEMLPPVMRATASTITYDAARGIQTTSLADGTTFVDLFDPQAFLRAPITLRN